MRDDGFTVYHHFQQYFTDIVIISVIGEGNQNTKTNQLTFYKPSTKLLLGVQDVHMTTGKNSIHKPFYG